MSTFLDESVSSTIFLTDTNYWNGVLTERKLITYFRMRINILLLSHVKTNSEKEQRPYRRCVAF